MNGNPEFPRSWDYSIHLPEVQKETKSILMKNFYHISVRDTGMSLLGACLSPPPQLYPPFYVGVNETPHLASFFVFLPRGGRRAIRPK